MEEETSATRWRYVRRESPSSHNCPSASLVSSQESVLIVYWFSVVDAADRASKRPRITRQAADSCPAEILGLRSRKISGKDTIIAIIIR